MHDHRLPRHDRPPETWLAHPGTPEQPPQAPARLDDQWSPVRAPAFGPATGPATGPMSARTPVLRDDASPFARFVFGLVVGKKSIPLAIGFALLGPLGLFYVSVLNGVAALVIVPYAVRAVAVGVAQALGGGPGMVGTLAVLVCWCITVPWSIIAARRRNARLRL